MAIDLIVLNGASSAGKTSLVRALQDVFEEPWILLEEDAFVFNTLAPPYRSSSVEDPILEKTLRGYYRSLQAFVSVGFRVIADLGLYTESIVRIFEAETPPARTLVVRVHCAIEELERRELKRGDRPIGLARDQAGTIHRYAAYDLEVDTTDGNLSRCAREVAERVAKSE